MKRISYAMEAAGIADPSNGFDEAMTDLSVFLDELQLDPDDRAELEKLIATFTLEYDRMIIDNLITGGKSNVIG